MLFQDPYSNQPSFSSDNLPAEIFKIKESLEKVLPPEQVEAVMLQIVKGAQFTPPKVF